MRKVISFNDNWKFIKSNQEQAKEQEYDDQHWLDVQIPHTWNAVDGASGFDYFQGACWYRKEFMIDSIEEKNRVYIEFNGSNSITNVYVNGAHIGEHRGGYSTFRFDITDAIQFGVTNVLAVQVDNTVVDDVYPQMADFTFYGGIYRDVNLVIADQIHFDLLDDGSKGIYIIQEDVTEEKAKLTIRTRVVNNSSDPQKVRVWADLLEQKDNIVTYGAKEVFLEAGETKIVDIPVEIDQPTLWNGKKNPYMYQAIVSLQSFNDTVDELSVPFGVRYFEVDSKRGFILNGQPLRLNGVSRHQDRKDKGWAISESDQKEDMALIKEIGATSIRLAHYQHDSFFYDLCDEEGMVVWAEIPFISVMSKNELEGINAKQQMKELVKQNYNHPSIVFWGIQNEIQIGGDRPELRKVVDELNDLTKSLDPTRLTTMANVMFVDEEDKYNQVTDTIGYNKYYGWYQGEVEEFADFLDGFQQKGYNFPLSISEYGAEGIIQYHSSTPKVRDYSEEYHALYHEKAWKIFEERPFLWATYVWNMFDFGANIRDEGGVQGRNNKGLVTYDRKVKKDAFYMYKAHWSEDKFVHIASKRFLDRAEDTIDIKIYTNCDEVTLYANGEKQGTQSGNDRVVVFEQIGLTAKLTEIKVVASDGNETYEDIARFNKVKEPNPSYFVSENAGGPVENWFDLPDLDDVSVEEIEISDDVFSTKSNFKELFANPETKIIMEKYLPGAQENPMFGMVEALSINELKGMAPDVFNEKLLYMLNKELTKIKKV